MSHSEAPRTGAELRAARESHGWSLDEVAAGLRIRRPFLKALEEGRASDLPGFAYAIGFLKTYAQALGLDPEEMARRFRAEAGEAVSTRTRLVFPEPVPERGVPAGAVVLLALVLGIGGYIGWHRYSARDVRTADVVPPVPARLEEAARQAPERATPAPAAPAAPVTIALPRAPAPEPAPAATTADPARTEAAPPAPVMASTPAPDAPAAPAAPATAEATAAPSEPPAQVVAATPPVPVAPPPVVVVPAPAIPPTSAAAAVPPPSEPAPPPVDRVVIRAKADAWINIRAQGGQVLLNRVLKAGESWTAPDGDLAGLTMITGNAGGTEIVLDGEPLAALGNSGAVRRDISLDPERLRALAPPRAAQQGARQSAPGSAQ